MFSFACIYLFTNIIFAFQMSGQQKYRVDTKDWPLENELAFIQILLEKMKQLGNISFKRAIWSEMDEELFAVMGERYGVDKLRGKFNRLRKKYREFSELIAHDHVVWDRSSNKILAPEDVWLKFCMVRIICLSNTCLTELNSCFLLLGVSLWFMPVPLNKSIHLSHYRLNQGHI